MVKRTFKFLIQVANRLMLAITRNNLQLTGSTFFFFTCKADKGNVIQLSRSTVERTSMSVKGANNAISAERALLSNCSIQINGSNNRLTIRSGVKLREATINIRGSHCSIVIGENTTFGGVRIVNVGNNNNVNIGSGCLFADHIEIWASDTHAILNSSGEMINREKSIEISDRVWIGSHVVILKGVVIESDSVVGMGTVVSGNIPANTVSVGNPNRVVKEGITWSLKY